MSLLDDGLATFEWTLDLTGVDQMTKAHIHLGAPGEIGPVAVAIMPRGAASSEAVLPEPLSGDLQFT